PTTAMGMGLPLLAASIESGTQASGRATALLCGVNTAGAALGVAWVGLTGGADLAAERVSLVAAAVQIIVVALVLSVARRTLPEDAPSAARPQSEGVRPQRAALVGAGCASAAAMLVQVSWTELLHQRFGTVGPGFSMTLLAFIGGLSLGGFLATRLLARDDDPQRTLVRMLALTALSLGLATLIAGTWVPGDNASALLAAAPLVPMTIAGGSLFPLFIAMSARRGTAIGRSVGSTGAASTAGAIAGSLGAMALLPLAGVGLSLFSSLALYSGLSVLFAFKTR
ncbi:MAG: hypothetical protein AAF658_11490, partial [Myxococcota bacterium]